MATLIPYSGKEFRLSTSTTLGGTYTLIKGLNSVTKNVSRTVNTEDTFDTNNAYSEPGPREVSYTVAGLHIPEDPGQLATQSAESTDTAVYFKFLPRGGSTDVVENVKGWTHLCKVGSGDWGSVSGGGASTIGFTLLSQEDAAPTGAGGYVIWA
jgi:hypothetical protein